MSERYISKFPGEVIDEAIEKSLHLNDVSDSYIIESSPDDIYDINELIEKGMGSYRIEYYEHSADDSSSVRPIDVRQRKINITTVEQSYEEMPGVSYYRTYDTITGLYTAWKRSDPVIDTANNAAIGVREKSIVFRVVPETNRSLKCQKYNGTQTVQTKDTPD